MPKKIVLTGATSFVGRNFVKHLLDKTDYEIYSIERLPKNNKELTPFPVFYHDLRAEIPESIVCQICDADYIVHMAAEVSASKSFNDPCLTVETNVVGTFHTLELARKMKNLSRFMYVSTGEVLGSVPFPFKLNEYKPLRPSSPYAASKASGEALVSAYHTSFEVPAVVVRPMNLFGPGQARGFVPNTVKNIKEHRTIRCDVNAAGSAGSRNWLHVDRFTEVLHWLLAERGRSGQIYHAVGPERDNLEVIATLAKALGKAPFIENVPASSFHDHRIVLEDTKLYDDCDMKSDLDEDLATTARWYA